MEPTFGTAAAATDGSIHVEGSSNTVAGNDASEAMASPSQGSFTQSTDAEQPRRKRQRIALACNPCRDRKMRCCLPLGSRYVVTPSDELQVTVNVHYAPVAKGEGEVIYASTKQVPSLDRGNLPPQFVLNSDKSEPASSSSGWRRVDPSTLARGGVEPAQWSLSVETGAEANSAAKGDLPEPPLSCESLPTDALTFAHNDNGLATYGGSSAVTLTTSLMQTLNSMHDSTKPPRLLFLVDEKTMGQKKFKHQPRGASHQAFTLPTRSVADRYVKAFFEFVHPMFPVIHRPSFYEKYYHFWTSETESGRDDCHAESDGSIFLAITHMVFALGSLYSDAESHQSRNGLAKQFYESSREVFCSDAADNMPFAGIQLLLLQAVYLQSTAYANRCWNIIGAAIRGAQSLGLHVFSVEAARGGQLQREMNKRVWYACVIFDRLLTLTFNRPLMIQSTAEHPLPQAVDDEYLLPNAEGCQPAGQEPRMNLFISSIKLWNTLYEVLSTFYSSNQNSCFVDKVEVHGWSSTWLNDLLRLDNELDALRSSVPESMRFERLEGTATQVEDSARLQIYVFQSRFLYIRALLLRPVLLVMTHHWRDFNIGSSKSGSLQQDVMIRICAHCVSTVTELVDLKCRGLQDSHSGPPWNTVHYMFVAAIAIAAAQLCPIPDPVFEQTSLKETWNRCIFILEHLKAQVEAASTALHVLNIVGKRIASLQKITETQVADSSTQPQAPKDSSFQEPPFVHEPAEPGPFLGTSNMHTGMGETLGDAWLSMEMINLDWFDIEL